MHRALRRAGWALAAAGGLGLAAPAWAQGTGMRVLGPTGHVAMPDASVIVAMGEGQARLEETQVELAWLADPVLFPLNVGAHAEGETLEVRGYVPNAVARDRAMKIAAERSTLRVVDRLRLHPTIAARTSIAPQEAIEKEARQLLAQSFGEAARTIEVKADRRGKLTVSGSIGSYQDQVAVSRKLRRVAGCTCVINELNVITVMRDGKAFSPVTSDGQHMVMEVGPTEVLPVTPPPAVVDRTPTGLQVVKPAVSHTPQVTPGLKPVPLGSGMPQVRPMPATETVRPLPAVPASARKPEPLPIPATAGPLPRETPSLPRPVSKPVQLELPTLPAPRLEPSSKPVTPPLPPRGETLPRPTPSILPATPPPLPPVPSSGESKRPMSGDSYVTTGVVTFAIEESEPAPKPPPTAPVRPVRPVQLSPHQLKERILPMCGPTIRTVEVVSRGGNALTINLNYRTITKPEAEAVCKKLKAMPELGPYRLECNVSVGP